MKTKWILFTTLISISLIALIGLFTSFTMRKNISINQNTTDDIIPKTQLQTNYENSLSSVCVVAFVSSGSVEAYRTATITSVSTTQMTMLLYYPSTKSNTPITSATPIIYFNNGEIFTVGTATGSSFKVSTTNPNKIYKYTLTYTSSSKLDTTGITAAKVTSTSATETDEVYGITSTLMQDTTEVYGFYANYLLIGTIQKLSQDTNTTTSKISGMLINMSPTSTILGTPIFNSDGELLTMIFYNYYKTSDSIDSILFACDQTQFKTTFATT